jgi:hypothetical protein
MMQTLGKRDVDVEGAATYRPGRKRGFAPFWEPLLLVSSNSVTIAPSSPFPLIVRPVVFWVMLSVLLVPVSSPRRGPTPSAQRRGVDGDVERHGIGAYISRDVSLERHHMMQTLASETSMLKVPPLTVQSTARLRRHSGCRRCWCRRTA